MGRGEIDFRNGVDLFIRVAHGVIRHGRLDAGKDSALRQAYFLWIGPERDRLFAALCRGDVERLGLSEQIRLVDIEDECLLLLLGSDLLLHTTRDAASVIARQEAEASGVPVIGFGTGGTSGRGSRVVDVDYFDTEALEQAVLLRGNRPARRTRASLSRVRQAPSWAGWHQQLTKVLTDCRLARA
jgi:glycosyltransferase involved in cell wall biosynthesis